jgi:hypothetical protein
LDLVAGTLIHLEDDDTMDLPGNFNGIGNVLSFDYQILRRGGRVGLEEKTTALP